MPGCVSPQQRNRSDFETSNMIRGPLPLKSMGLHCCRRKRENTLSCWLIPTVESPMAHTSVLLISIIIKESAFNFQSAVQYSLLSHSSLSKQHCHVNRSLLFSFYRPRIEKIDIPSKPPTNYMISRNFILGNYPSAESLGTRETNFHGLLLNLNC